MALFSGVTYTFANDAPLDASYMNTNFTDLKNAITDGGSDIFVAKVGAGVTPTNQLDVAISTAGSTLTAKVAHSDNTSASSHAIIQVQSGGGSGGDPYTQYTTNGVTDWVMGIDNAGSSLGTDPLVISKGTAVGTTPAIAFSTDTIPYVNMAVNEKTPAAAIASGSMITQSVAFYLDTAAGKLYFKTKDSTGTVKSGSVSVS